MGLRPKPPASSRWGCAPSPGVRLRGPLRPAPLPPGRAVRGLLARMSSPQARSRRLVRREVDERRCDAGRIGRVRDVVW